MAETEPRDRLAGTLDRLSRTLWWPSWGTTRHSADVGDVASPSDAVASALGVAREVADGGAYIRIFETAVEEAQRQRMQRDPRPLAGLPVAIKDLVAVAGHPLGCGSAVRHGAEPERRHSAIVAQLVGLGAVPVGLVALHEFAFGVTGINDHTGYPRNPADGDRIPGGSSSGSAVAVAEGSAVVAVGTDTGGSVRIPAALCGVVGFKPGYGRYPTDGVFRLAPSLDHVGLIAPSVDLVVRVHAALGHPVPSGHHLLGVGVVEPDLEEADDAVVQRVEAALRALRRADVAVGPVPWPDAERSFATSTAIMFSEASAIHRETLERVPDRYGADVRRRLEAGFAIDAPTYVAARREQRVLRDEVAGVLRTVDAVLTPTVPMLAPTVDVSRDPDVSARLVRNTRLANVVGAPAISVPVPGAGLPAGLQLTARDEPTLLAAAARVEEILAGCQPGRRHVRTAAPRASRP